METNDKATIDALRTQILLLEAENKRLRDLLYKAGIISSTDDESCLIDESEIRNQNKINEVRITKDHARVFYSYFWGRMDVFSRRYENKKKQALPAIIRNVIFSGDRVSAQKLKE